MEITIYLCSQVESYFSTDSSQRKYQLSFCLDCWAPSREVSISSQYLHMFKSKDNVSDLQQRSICN